MSVEPCIEGSVAAPVLVVSSKAGLGNYHAGAELARRIAATHAVEHVAIEQLASARRVRSDFERHRAICLRAPWLLHLVHDLPLSYLLKQVSAAVHDGDDARVLEGRVRATAARTIIALNSRAALWLGALKHHGRLRAALRVFVTDYALSMGWRYQFWSQVERAYGPFSRDEMAPALRGIYRQVEMPVREGFTRLAARPGAVDRVVLCGGAWGLGGLDAVSAELARQSPHVKQYVVCGDNEALRSRVRALAARHPSVEVVPPSDHLEEVMDGCASIITKPGGLTLAEAHAARRRIFLLDGLPGVERKNRAYAERHMGATRYTPSAFARWVAQRTHEGGTGVG